MASSYASVSLPTSAPDCVTVFVVDILLVGNSTNTSFERMDFGKAHIYTSISSLDNLNGAVLRIKYI